MGYKTRMIDGMTKAELKIKKRDYRSWIQHYLRVARSQGAQFKFSDEMADPGTEVNARIDWGRWIADCECGGAETVTPEDPVFYCLSCGNSLVGGRLRTVNFPPPGQIKKIEDLLMERPLDTSRGVGRIGKAMRSQPQVARDPETGRVHILSWSWDPGQSLKDLKKENKFIKKVGNGRGVDG